MWKEKKPIERERKSNDNCRWETVFKNFCWGLESTSSGKLDHLIQFFALFRMVYFSWSRNEVKFFRPGWYVNESHYCAPFSFESL